MLNTLTTIPSRRDKVASLGFLIPRTTEGAKTLWMEGTGAVTEWDASAADTLDFITGVTDAQIVTEHLGASAPKGKRCRDIPTVDVVDDLVAANLLVRIPTGDPADTIEALSGCRAVFAAQPLLDDATQKWVAQSLVEGGGSVPIDNLTRALIDAGDADIPTVVTGFATTKGTTPEAAVPDFLSRLDALISQRCALLVRA